jgi:hypothetical protein
MNDLQERFGRKIFEFADDNLMVDENWFRELLHALRNSPNRLTWMAVCAFRAASLTPALLNEMRAAGAEEIGFGTESGDDAVLQTLGKGFTSREMAETIRMTEAAGLRAMLFIMAGAPGETPQSWRKTRDLFFDTLPSNVVANYYYPVPGTPSGDWVQKHGRLNPECSPYLCCRYGHYEIEDPPFETPGYSLAQRKRTLRRYVMLRMAAFGFGDMANVLAGSVRQNGLQGAADVFGTLWYWAKYHWRRGKATPRP